MNKLFSNLAGGAKKGAAASKECRGFCQEPSYLYDGHDAFHG